uniref:Cadherin domain-containing protein n=1 Tax=Tetraodon nigroviridis TaxID=99883 RepID=H3C212_TETNG
CVAPEDVEIPENNKVGDLVATINLQPGATVTLSPPEGSENPFLLNGTQLLAAIVFDAEKTSSFSARLLCRPADGAQFPFIIVVLVKNLNDNPPEFQQTVYKLNVSESKNITNIKAPDLSLKLDRKRWFLEKVFVLFLSLQHGFKLSSPTVPDILIQTPPNYDTVQKVSLTLFVQDTPLTSPGIVPSYNDSTTVEITILDVDNRPPWFQPCTKYNSGGNVICSSSGYTGRVTLNKKEPGFLKLNPGPLYAIDGDDGINEEITYKILGGNDGNLFEIKSNTGNVSMQREADTLETITLTVLASQKNNSFQATSTSVTITVLTESLHLPQFQSPRYQGSIAGVGNMALDMKNEPLQFIATDADYEGLNPNIDYSVSGRDEFSIVGGFLFMTKNLPEATLNLQVQVVAKDTYNDETATAELQLEVKSGRPRGTTTKPSESTDGTGVTTAPSGTTTKPSGSTDGTGVTTAPSGTTTKPSGSTDGTGVTTAPSGTTTKPSGSTDGTGVTTAPSGTTTKPSESTDGTGSTTNPTGTTTKPSGSTDGTGSTTIPSGTTTNPSASTTKCSTGGCGTSAEPNQTTNGPVPTANTPRPLTVIVPSGGYGSNDMAALGATLGVLLCVCLVFKITKKKNIVPPQLNKGFGGEKEGIQYTNDAFTNDEDGSSTRSGSPDRRTVIAPEQPRTIAPGLEKYLTSKEPSGPAQDDVASQSGSDGDDKEKEVKPILTKGRKQDEGYKSVWFKEDIDPEAMEEVVIIPDSRENDSDNEEQQQTGSHGEESNRG